MARNNPLHIDIPSVPSHLHNKKSTNHGGPHSPGGMFTTTNEGDDEASFFSLTRNGSQYPDSPSSDISSPMMTPLPFKMMMMPQPNTTNMFHLLTPVTPAAVDGVEKDDRKKLREYEFPSPTAMTSPVAMKVEAPAYQAYQNHPFTQLRQPKQQPQQQLSAPPTAKATTPSLSYSAKYADFTNNSTAITTPQQQTVVRVSPRPTHTNKDNSTRKPSTTMALSMIEKEKMAYQYPPSHRVSMVSPPPPPYISSSSSPSSDHGAGVGTPITTIVRTQSAASAAAAVIAIAPPLQVPDQQQQHSLQYDPTTSSSLAAKSKRHSLPVALARSVSSSSFSTSSSPAIIVAESGVMASDGSVAAAAPRVFSSKASSRDVKRHSLAGIPSSMSTMSLSNNNMARPNKTYGHRSISNMPPQAIPIYASTGSAADMMMKTPPTVFNPRASFSSSFSPSTRLLERTVNAADTETVLYNLKHHHHHHHVNSSTTEEGTEKDLSALIGPEHDHKNNLLSLSHTNINAHNLHTSSSLASSPPRMQGLLRIASLQRATAAASAAERNLILSTSRIGGGPTSMGMGPLERTEFPGFWEDARQRNMHWTVYTIGLAAVASLAWVLMLPALMMFVPILPGTVVLLMGVQYSVYRWRRRRHYNQQLKDRRPSPAALSSMRAASAALTGTTSLLTHSRSSSAVATAPSSPQFHAFSPNHHHLSHMRGISGGGGGGTGMVGVGGLGHAYKSSLSSMHTSVGSVATNDSFLEPHQPSLSSSSGSPPHHLKTQFQHQYYRQPNNGSATSSSATGSPPRFSEVYGADLMSSSPSPPTSSTGPQAHAGNQYPTPSPEYRRSWFSAFRTPANNNSSDTKNSNSNCNSNSGRWARTIQRRESTSSIASSETVSSSSTDSACDSNDSGKGSPTAARAATGVAISGSHSSDTGSFSSIPMTSPRSSGEKKNPSGDLSTTTMMTPPPPAYVSRRCEDIALSLGGRGSGVNEKLGLHHSLQQDIEKKMAVVVLPEITPLGDLMSEFTVDFGAIRY
ncbi:hypothetical protein BGZ96_000544 [Linnemannia gamsii]|uniref:Uncharacterized protein n=1 Tax=Linnemannia gamsii TaxID=64522 RepID=A0ABQ7JP11_9FUNG|nr:hypothetical protein BGZ96_000544 [Linnemannia gamsii]